MAHNETRKKRKNGKKDGDDQTFREIEEVRKCQKFFTKKYCTPWIKDGLRIHLAPTIANDVVNASSGAAGATAGALTASGIGVPAAAISALAAVLVKVVAETERNPNGSLDIFVGYSFIKVGSKSLPMPTTWAASIIEGFS